MCCHLVVSISPQRALCECILNRPDNTLQIGCSTSLCDDHWRLSLYVMDEGTLLIFTKGDYGSKHETTFRAVNSSITLLLPQCSLYTTMGEHHRHKKRKHEDHHSERKRHRHGEKKHKHHRSRHESRSPTSSANDLEELKRLAKLYNKKEEKKHNDTPSTSSKAHNSSKHRVPMIPQTKEDYEKQRSVIRHEYDPETGRMRWDG